MSSKVVIWKAGRLLAVTAEIVTVNKMNKGMKACCATKQN